MKNSIINHSNITHAASPLILATLFLYSNSANADVQLTCSTSGGTECPSGANTISDALAPLVSNITVPATSCIAGSVTDVNVSLDIEHTWVGDLEAELIGPGGAPISLLLDRPGEPALGGFGCNNDNAFPPSAILATFDDASMIPAEDQCDFPNPAISGTVSPSTPLSVFNAGDGDGVWTLRITDSIGGDEGNLNDWTLDISCTSPNPATEIPIFSIWGLLSLIGALGLGGRFFTRRRKHRSK